MSKILRLTIMCNYKYITSLILITPHCSVFSYSDFNARQDKVNISIAVAIKSTCK